MLASANCKLAVFEMCLQVTLPRLGWWPKVFSSRDECTFAENGLNDTMKDTAESGYRLLKRGIALSFVVIALAGATVSGAFAHGTFDGGEKVGKVLDYGDYSLASSTYAINVKDTIYQYATGEDGNAYYTSKNGQEWSKWEGWDNQPVNFSGDPAPIAYLDQNYAFYHGEDDHIYHLIWNADGTSYFADVSGDYTFKSAPYANVWQDQLFLYATGTDGYDWNSWYTSEE